MRNIVFALSIAAIFGAALSQSFQPIKPAEVNPTASLPVFGATTQASIDLAALITTLTSAPAFTADFHAELYSTLSNVINVVIKAAIQDWKDAVNSNAIITNYASQINAFQTRYQQRYNALNQTVVNRLANPNLLGIIRENGQIINGTYQFLGMINNVTDQTGRTMNILNNQSMIFRNSSQNVLDQIGQIKAAIDTQVATDNTNITTFLETELTRITADLNAQLGRQQTFVDALKAFMLNYVPASSASFYDALATDRNFDLTALKNAINQNTTALGSAVTALLTQHTSGAYADINTQLDGILTNLTSFVGPVLNPTAAGAQSFDTLVTKVKELWNTANNLIVYLNYITQAIAKQPQLESYLFNRFTDDFTNTLSSQFFLNSQYDEIYEQLSSILKSINRLNSAMNVAGTGYGSLDVVFYAKNWDKTAPPASSTIPAFLKTTATIYSWALPSIAYSDTVTPKIINCAIIDPLLSFVMAYDWFEDTAATPKTFRIFVAVNDAIAASGNVRCTVIYDLKTGGQLAETLPAANTNYATVTAAPDIFAAV